MRRRKSKQKKVSTISEDHSKFSNDQKGKIGVQIDNSEDQSNYPTPKKAQQLGFTI